MTSSSIVARIGIATLCTGGVMALAMCGDDKPMNTVQDMAMSTADMTVITTPDMAIVQPTVTTLSKTSDFTKGGTSIMINGTGFKSGATVKFGTLTAAVTNVTATAITVTVPANTGKPGKYDIVVTNTDGGTVTLAKGFAYTIETIAWQNVKPYAHTTANINGPRAVYAAELDGKQGLDVVTINAGTTANTLSVYTNGGDASATLTAKTPVALTNCTNPFSAVIADVTGDASLDIVVPCKGSNNALVLKGDGTGTFTIAQTLMLPAASAPQSVTALNSAKDGKIDTLVFALSNTTTTNLYRFTGSNGTFTAAPTQAPSLITANAYAVTSADLDKDGVPDLIATYAGNATADNVAVALSKNASTAKLKSGSVNPFWPVVGDVDNNMATDIVVSNNAGTMGSFTLFTSDGQQVPAFTAKTPVVTTTTMPEGIALGDIDADGFLDVVTANAGATTATASDLTTFQGDGKGGFATGKTLSTGSVAANGKPIAVAIADINGDGRPDILAANYLAAGGQLVVLLNDSK